MSLPTSMREIFFDGAGGPEVIKLHEAPVPAPGPGKVLVQVVAAGINRPDCIQRAGWTRLAYRLAARLSRARWTSARLALCC